MARFSYLDAVADNLDFSQDKMFPVGSLQAYTIDLY